MNHEVEALKSALAASPDNLELKKILHSKMILDVYNYKNELFDLSTDIHKKEPDYLPAVEDLIRYYFENEKFSTCEIILQKYEDFTSFSKSGLIRISKIYVALEQNDRASEIYKLSLEKYPDAQDEELDALFRMPTNEKKVNLKGLSFMQKPSESFKDVGGMQNVKREINLKIIQPLKNEALFKQYGKKIGGGILLYGPPGCGKTFIARATAGEIDAQFLSLGLNDILSMWMGNSEKNLHEFFEHAREHNPSVVFIDEIDALGMKRAQFGGSAGRNVVNQLLTEMDGVDTKNEGVLVIGATNAPWDLDAALRRPGRFDRIIFVPPPDLESRATILELKLKDKPCDQIDYSLVASKTKGFSGADIDAIIDIAVEKIIEQALETGETLPIRTKDLISAASIRSPSTREWFNTVKNYTVFSNKSGLYDDVVEYMNSNRL